MAYNIGMVFLETEIFTEDISGLLTDSGYRELQEVLVANPRAGAVIPNCGGVRKLRWKAKGHGKRGGIWVIYYYLDLESQIYMLLAYAKNAMDGLSSHQKKALKKLVKEELR